MTQLKVAVIGCGSIAKHRHIPEYLAHPEIELVAVCDINETRAKEMAQEHGIPTYYTDYQDLLQDLPSCHLSKMIGEQILLRAS